MEQKFPPHHVIVDWLADYTHFICDHFSLPHDQADGLLQQYLNPTARGPPQQSTTSPYEQSSGSPEVPNLYPEAHFQEQRPNPYLATHLTPLNHPVPSNPYLATRLMPLNHPVPSNPHHEARVEGDADHLSSSWGMLARNTTSQSQFVAYDQQPGNMMTTNLDLPEASITPPQPTQTLNQTPIGSITDYDPLWIQNNNVDPLRVTQFRSDTKFDTLFSQRVIKLGDVLIFQVSTTTTNGQTQKTEAHLKIIGTSRSATRPGVYPDLSISVANAPGVRYPEAKACSCPTVMMQHLQSCNITAVSSAWCDIQVLRGGQALGSLRWIVKAFHLWRDDKDREAQETGQTFRRRVARGKGRDGATQFRGAFGVWRDGVFWPDQDQARYRVRG
ncbi:MAG: hypothetical protein Q9161_007606 [Pseudevernia consocians]